MCCPCIQTSKCGINPILFIFIIYLLVILCSNNVLCKQPNIIFIVADDLGWNDVGFHGENAIPTPNIDALAYHGLILNRHYTQPTCSPSRAAFLTGKYPFRYGLVRPIAAGVPEAVPVTEKLLPQYLQELGYSTHLIGKWHIGCHTHDLLPFNRGFTSHTGYWNGYLTYNDSIHHSDHSKGYDARRNDEKIAPEMSEKYLTEFLTDQSIAIIKSHNHTKPLYLQISHAAVHTAKGGTADQEAGIMQVPDLRENDRTFAHIANPDRRLFAGMLKSLDESIGKVIQSLEEERLLENSVVVFITDNGGPTIDPLWFHGNTASNWPLRGTKSSLREGGVRGVAAVWSPYLRKSQVLDSLFHLTDWLPTLYFIAGGDSSNLSKDLDGFNQWNTLNGSAVTKSRDSLLVDILPDYNDEALIKDSWKLIRVNTTKAREFANNHYSKASSDDLSQYSEINILHSKTSVILSKYKQDMLTESLIKRLRMDSSVVCNASKISEGNCMDRYCLYNINDDPCEYSDIADEYPEKVQQLTKLLNQYKIQKDLIPSQEYDYEEIASPIYWDGYWSTWKDHEVKLYVMEAITILAGTLLVLIYLYYMLFDKIF